MLAVLAAGQLQQVASPGDGQAAQVPERLVAGDEGCLMEERLGGKHPVERIGMVPVEASGADGVGCVDVEVLCSQSTGEGVVLGQQDLSFRPLAGAVLDCDFPCGRGGHQHRVRGCLDRGTGPVGQSVG